MEVKTKSYLRSGTLVRELYPTEREKALNVYYFINELMEEETPRLLARRFNVIQVFSRADRDERSKNAEEERLFRIYAILKGFINYADERVRDIPALLFGG